MFAGYHESMELSWTVFGILNGVSILLLALNLYEYRRVLQKRSAMWLSMTGEPAFKPSRTLVGLYILCTAILAFASASVLLRSA